MKNNGRTYIPFNEWSYKSKQTEYTEPTPLLNPDGTLNAKGWARHNVFEYDIDTDPTLLEEYCAKVDFVFNLAGVNRPENNDEFMEGNFGFASTLLATLKKNNNTCPIMLSSSVQATLSGRYGISDYGKSKLAGEELFFD